jgi:protein SCO1/2
MDTGLNDRRAKLSHAVRFVVIGLFAMTAVGQEIGSDHAAHMAMASHDAAATQDDHGIVVDFELIDRNGNVVSDEDFRGRYVLLGFGFTHCAHICPLMALNIGRVVKDAGREMTGIFVSVDSERDSAAITHEYATHFGDSMLGLSGSIEQLNAAAKNFKVSYAVTKTQDAYTVQHTANVFLIDPNGDLVDVFSFSTSPDSILAKINATPAGR